MTFANPLALLWGLLAVPVILLYRSRLRLRRESVATDMIWQQVFAQQRGRTAWQPWRHGVSLALQLAILALFVLAMAEPVIPGPKRITLVIDSSASMKAGIPGSQPSRIEEAKATALRLVAGLRDCDRMAVLSAGEAVGMRCAFTANKSVLQEAIEGVSAGDGVARVPAAVELARRMLAEHRHGRIMVLGDGGFDGVSQLAAADHVEMILVGRSVGNVAVTRLQARRSIADPRKCQVLVEARSFCDRPVECGLGITLDGKPVDTISLKLPNDGRWRQVFEMTTPAAATLAATIDRQDARPGDNQASVQIPAAGVHRVVLVTAGNRYLQSVFEANQMVELTVTDRPPDGAGEGAVVVFDRQVPDTLPAGPVMVVSPGASCDLWQLGDVPADGAVAGQQDASAILQDVRLLGVRLPEARQLRLSPAASKAATPLAWNAGGEPLLVAIERPAGRVLVLLGDLHRSDLPLRSAFVILMSNALDWLGGIDRSDEFRPSLAERPVVHESDIRVPADVGIDAGELQLRRPGLPPWTYLATLGLVLLAVEWCLYQRRWIS